MQDFMPFSTNVDGMTIYINFVGILNSPMTVLGFIQFDVVLLNALLVSK